MNIPMYSINFPKPYIEDKFGSSFGKVQPVQVNLV